VSVNTLSNHHTIKSGSNPEDITTEPFKSFIAEDTKSVILAIIDKLNMHEGAKILEVGCGNGTISVELSKRKYSVIGVDVSSSMIELAQEKNSQSDGKCDFRIGNAEDLDFDDNTFDIVIANGLLEYIEWQRWALQEIHRVIKPQGYLLIITANRLSLKNLLDPGWYAAEIKTKLEAKFGSKYSNKSQITDRPRNQLAQRIRRDLSQLHFEIVSENSHGFGTFPILSRFDKLSKSIYQAKSNALQKKGIPLIRELGNELIFLTRKRILPTETGKRPVFTNIDQSKKIFENEYTEYFKRCQKWVGEHPEYKSEEISQFEEVIGNRDRILVISPHPDDEIIGCGGTLIKMVEQGRQVVVVHLLDGCKTLALSDADENMRHTARLKEAEEVSDFIGFSELVLFKIDESEFSVTDEYVTRLNNLIQRIKPQIIFTPFINDPHPDHQASNEILSRVLTVNRCNLTDLIIIGYECWSIIPAGTVSTISNEFDRKIEALMKYKIAMRVVDYVHFCEKLNAYHHYTLLQKAGYAERFFNTTAGTFIKLQKQTVSS